MSTEIPKSGDSKNIDTIFIDNPGDYLSKNIANELRKVSQWNNLFKGSIDAYKRMDYQMSALPALRIYNETFKKQFDSWFIEGDITMDLILPASLRRYELEDVPGQISGALLQQFRRPSFFEVLRELVPGLNELGKEFDMDKTMGFEMTDNIVPLTQIRVNFRIDLREWDSYLESENRTKDDPFEVVLGDLEKISLIIEGVEDDLETTNIENETEINIGE